MMACINPECTKLRNPMCEKLSCGDADCIFCVDSFASISAGHSDFVRATFVSVRTERDAFSEERIMERLRPWLEREMILSEGCLTPHERALLAERAVEADFNRRLRQSRFVMKPGTPLPLQDDGELLKRFDFDMGISAGDPTQDFNQQPAGGRSADEVDGAS
ncbi:hypothetical protein GPECTOR_4g601 [Gonium pectorale]|uniref:Uncharacterized protein n=1 Tax=Gonium pectorale TaxID=33097 RepID=A0A150GXA1_GONPE|nr:hypothetical protein GPECTOR_4g601 [Gonium pectorale]|eukprot:KXZ54536.1 hypothetical protein GPECTOR_4g601 [Gonium pectorale]